MLGSFFAGLSGGGCGLGALTGGLDLNPVADEWYPLESFDRVVDRIAPLTGSERLLERFGAEMMKNWYDEGGGRDIVSTGIDYLRLQRYSRGYEICVRGPRQVTGHFRLVDLDAAGGWARIESRTVVPRAYERGVLQGGLEWAGDLLFFDVREHPESQSYLIFFVNRENMASLKWHRGTALSETQWNLANQRLRAREREVFWRWIGGALVDCLKKESTCEASTPSVSEPWALNLSELSDREMQVVAGVLDGRTLRRIADDLHIAYTSVLTYQHRAFVKLGVSTQKDLFRLFRS